MRQSCWNTWPDRGFLVSPDPLPHLSALGSEIPLNIIEHIEGIASQLPHLLETGKVRGTLDALPLFDLHLNDADSVDYRLVERLMMLYSYFASAYVHATPDSPANRIPSGVAVPLHRLSQLVERPPILSYSGYVLNNWRRIDASGAIELENLALLQNFLGGRDEEWFILVHVDIEARAAGALQGIQDGLLAVEQHDVTGLEQALCAIARSVEGMLKTFDRMPEQCDSNVYYFRVRPYIFGFNDIVYEGVSEYGGKPQSFRGQTGAQSSIVPALVASLGLQHEQSGLTQHLQIMRDYMPKPHREFISGVTTSAIRDAVMEQSSNSALKEAYNLCLRRVLDFRRMHFHYATTYIADKVKNPLGTGGTIFMDWLGQLADETEKQLV